MLLLPPFYCWLFFTKFGFGWVFVQSPLLGFGSVFVALGGTGSSQPEQNQ